mmetsp:Transcript_8375/g.29775  ORF Transcript_8375/g.29775 Transcript_8375/m.29775 type:complete len:208 (+) Transcript_8375:1594-2217(+)
MRRYVSLSSVKQMVFSFALTVAARRVGRGSCSAISPKHCPFSTSSTSVSGSAFPADTIFAMRTPNRMPPAFFHRFFAIIDRCKLPMIGLPAPGETPLPTTLCRCGAASEMLLRALLRASLERRTARSSCATRSASAASAISGVITVAAESRSWLEARRRGLVWWPLLCRRVSDASESFFRYTPTLPSTTTYSLSPTSPCRNTVTPGL